MSKKDDKVDDGNPTVFPAKYEKIIKEMPEFKDTADAADTEELKKIIVQCEGNIFTVEDEKSKDEKLIACRELMKDLSSGYRDAIKYQTAKIKYALFLLDGKGEELDNRSE